MLSSRLPGAFLNVPRHPFVPIFYRRDGERFIPWRITHGDPDAWLDAVYADDSLSPVSSTTSTARSSARCSST